VITKNKKGISIIFICLIIVLIPATISAQNFVKSGKQKQIVIENFDSGSVNLTSYPIEDEDPDDWELSSSNTYENSPWSLRIFGNTWKVQNISPILVDTGDVWQVSAYIASKAEIQGFAIMDATNVLRYSFAGSEEVSISEWVPVYQGCFPEDEWNVYQLPVADDWIAFFGYLPEITEIVYINDKDGTSQGTVYFDNIIDITSDLPQIPEVSIEFSLGDAYLGNEGSKVVDVQFTSNVTDPDSDDFDYYWNFGDDSTSTEKDPAHTFIVTDDHPYHVLLQVVDPTGRWGQASISVDVDPGNSSFPVTLNFVGDIMLARKYEYPGGIIPTEGVEAIFEPTKSVLGEAADITVANMECPLTTHWDHHPTKSIYFKGSPDNVDGLTYAGIDVVTLANNHILDYLLPGMQETQSVLEENNILHMGAGANSYEAYLPTFYSKSGLNFAFLGASDKTGQYNNYQPYLNAGYNKSGFAYLEPYYIKKQIEDVRDVADLVVLEWHTGAEYSFDPGYKGDTSLFALEDYEDENYFPRAFAPESKDRATSQFAIDNGADLVISHHPHIMQGVELYNGKLIAHSLGDFVFDLDYPETYPSFILNAKVNETGFYEFTLTPIYIDDYIPQRAYGGLGLHILDDLAQRSKDLDTYLSINRDSVIATVVMDTTNMPIYQNGYSALIEMEEDGSNWVTSPYRLQKAGSISSVDSIVPDSTYDFRLGRELIWFGNMEDEGCTLWNLNSSKETYCDTVAKTGFRSVQHIRLATNTSNIVTNLEERILFPSDTSDYSLCGYIKTHNAANVTVQIRYYESRSSFFPMDEEKIGIPIDGDTPWTYYHQELSIPSGAGVFDIRLYSGVPDLDTAYSWFDNISLVQWDDWSEYDISQNIPTPNDYYFIQVKSSDNSDEIVLHYSETAYESVDHSLTADIKVFLEGPFNGTDMNTHLTAQPAPVEGFPFSQPYTTAPWDYYGSESVDSIPNPDIVDWILLEFRDAIDAASATSETMIARQAAFLLNNGQIVGLDGVEKIHEFSLQSIINNLFVVIHHRNHISTMSANPMVETDGIYTYDFTTSVDQAYGGNVGFKIISPGISGMAGGDTDASGTVDNTDKVLWELYGGASGYLLGDMNLDGEVNNIDKNEFWILNKDAVSSQVPE